MLFSRAIHLFPALPNRGRRECRAADAPDSRVCHVEQERTRVSRVHRNHPAFPTQWFTDYTCAPRCSGFLATVTPEEAFASQELDTSVEVSGLHDFSVRK